MNKKNLSEAEILRRKAEEVLLKRKSAKAGSRLSEAETLKLVHDLEVHQIELEMLNDALVLAKERAEDATEKYIDLYDFSPSGYFTLSRKGEIIEINLTGAKMLGKERIHLKKSEFVSFLSANSKVVFNSFIDQVFQSNKKETCELALTHNEDITGYVHLTGIAAEDREQCRITAVDITERKLAEQDAQQITETLTFLAQYGGIEIKMGFFESLAKYLARAIDADFVCIDRLEGDGLNARTLAVWHNGVFEDNVVYALKDTPCGDVVGKSVCSFPASVTRFFPRDTVLQELKAESYVGVTLWSYTGVPIGLIAVIKSSPLQKQKQAEELLKIVAVRASGELERIEAEAELLKNKEKTEESEALLRAAMENSQAGIAIAECPSGKLKYVNKAALMIRAKDYDEIVKDIDLDKYVASWQILHFDGTPFQPDEVPLARAILYGETNSREFIVRRDNNEDRYVWANAAPIFSDNGIQTAAIVVFLDITESKKVEKALIRSEHELKKAQEITHIGSWYLDVASNEVVWTHELYKMYGFDPTLPPPPYTEHIKLFTTESWDTLSTSLAHTAETGMPYVLELKTVRKDGSNGWMWVRGEALKDTHGKTIGLWGATQDISERKLMEEALIIAKNKAEESDRLKSAFLANMSHEIRTPMNGILGFTELLKEPDLTGPEKEKYIHVIEKSGARMLNIINDIISISKVESGQMEVNLSETNINEQIEYLGTFFKPEAAQKGLGLSFSCSIPGKEAILTTDREKVYAILTNLIKNAIKFTRQGFIEVGCTKRNKYLELFVKDTGIGIPEGQKEIIFERFRQGSDSLTRNYEGAGLGLSISKAYVEILGGKIWVDSEYGKGSAFYFTIPCDAQPEKDVAMKPVVSEKKETNPVKNLKILIVDDDEASQMYISLVIQKYSHEIVTAGTGVQAIEICRNNPDIDLILMDIKMPEMDGFEATRTIRKFYHEVIIIAQTAFSLTGDREKALQAGCNDYISKPIKKDELGDMIEKYFRK
jgi:PAS domain S-box-containing protein